MRKVLIIASGIVAKHFLGAAAKGYGGKNDFLVVASSRDDLPPLPENFDIHIFDSTSFFKLNKLFSNDIIEVFIISDSEEHTIESYKVIRVINKDLVITILDSFGLNIEDKNATLIDSAKLLANRLLDKLPNVPVFAQSIGLGMGEVMEVSVPFGSSFVYRSISTIYQHNWKIVGIYRKDKLLIAKNEDVIQPDDNLLVIGDPVVLRNVYQAIKRELGQFPAPFGNNIYLYIDMRRDCPKEIIHMVDESLVLNKKLKNKRLIIRITNPTNIELYDHLKSLESKSVIVDIDFRNHSFAQILEMDFRRYSIGLIMLSKRNFMDYQNLKILYKMSVPVLKFGKGRVEESKDGIVLMSQYQEIQEISPVVFDISSQIDSTISIYEYIIDDDHKSEIIEHYTNLSRIYNKRVEFFVLENTNPIRAIRKKKGVVQFLPFNNELLRSRRYWFLSTSIERVYFILGDNYQVFIPVKNIN